MKTKRVLTYAGQVLALRQQIVADQLAARNDAALQFAQTHDTVNQHRRAIAMSRLSVIEAAARVRQLTSPKSKPVDPLELIEKREQQLLAKLHADANIRAAVEKRLRAQAAQAALDRATFVDQVKRDLPEELWDDTIDMYDRRVFESGEDGES